MRTFGRDLQLLEICLTRSGSCPLSIELYGLRIPLPRIVPVILPHFARVEHLWLPCPAKLNAVSAPHTAFLKAPRLQSVYLTDVDYRPFSSKILLPWDQLTTLVLELVTPDVIS
jgi:hypothetical protein